MYPIGRHIYILLLSVVIGTIAVFTSNEIVFAAGKTCGNGVCQASLGENTSSCPVDCGPQPTATPRPNPTSPPQPTIAPTSVPQPTTVPTSILQPTTAPTSNPESTPIPTSGPDSPTPTTPPGSNTGPSNQTSNQSSTNSPTFFPAVNLTTTPRSPSNNTQPTFAGSAVVERGNISSIEYRIDNADWIQISPSDSNYNSSSEGFSLTLSRVDEGSHRISFRAKSDANVYTSSDSYVNNDFIVATTPPRVIISPIKPNPTKNQTPTISVNASTTLSQIQSVELSIDNGKTWQIVSGSGKNYTLKLAKLEDGNYPLIARATDTAGNVGRSQVFTLIVDTIPPIIGGGLFNIGPQSIPPLENGVMRLVSGVQARLVMSMKGGVTAAKVKIQDESFELIPQIGTNLWFADIKVAKPDNYQLKIDAVDGAENFSSRILGQITAENYGVITDKLTAKDIQRSIITVYYYHDESGNWFVWNGQSFGQQNPQTSDSSGHYSFMLPPGKYYLEIKAQGYRTVNSQIFETDTNLIVNSPITLQPIPTIRLSLPYVGTVNLSIPTIPESKNIIGQQQDKMTNNPTVLNPGSRAPMFSLPGLDGKKVSLSDFEGKRLLVFFFSPWSPASREQMMILHELNDQMPNDTALLVIALQESVSKIETFMKRGSYEFPILIDEDGKLANDYKVTFLPQYFLIDKNGVIQDSRIGVVSLEQALEQLKIVR